MNLHLKGSLLACLGLGVDTLGDGGKYSSCPGVI